MSILTTIVALLNILHWDNAQSVFSPIGFTMMYKIFSSFSKLDTLSFDLLLYGLANLCQNLCQYSTHLP